jgi:hypothetical protein
MTDKYQALLAKLKEATGPFEFNKAMGLAWGIYPNEDVDDDRVVWLELALRDSLSAIGAALALVEMELPIGDGWAKTEPASSGWRIGVERGITVGDLALWMAWCRPHGKDPYIGEHVTPALAILMAWCQAMIQKEQSE